MSHRKMTGEGNRREHRASLISIGTELFKLLNIRVSAGLQTVGTHTVNRYENNLFLHFVFSLLFFLSLKNPSRRIIAEIEEIKAEADTGLEEAYAEAEKVAEAGEKAVEKAAEELKEKAEEVKEAVADAVEDAKESVVESVEAVKEILEEK